MTAERAREATTAARERAEGWVRRALEGRAGPWGALALRGAAAAYGLGADAVNLGYDLGLRRVRRLPAPVIGVGNLAMGGTGKTPLVVAVVEALAALGLPAGVISRGYGGDAAPGVTWVFRGEGPVAPAEVVGDEPVMLARRLGVPVAVAAERYAAGREMLRRRGPLVLVGDDLFQHRRLHRDLDIVALDASCPSGPAGLPAGLYREPLGGLRRAQAVVLTRAEDQAAEAAWRALLARSWGPGPVLACRHRLTGLSDPDGRQRGADALAGVPVLGFCGLASPGGFEASLRGLGLDLRGLEAFGDHHRFTLGEVLDLWVRAREVGARALVCSEKDAARLPAGLVEDARPWVTRLELEFTSGPGLAAVLAWGLSGWRPA